MAGTTQQFGVQYFHDFGRPVATGCNSRPFTGRAPRVRTKQLRNSRPVKADWIATAEGLNDVLANKALVLPTVDAAIELSWLSHRKSLDVELDGAPERPLGAFLSAVRGRSHAPTAEPDALCSR